MHWTLMLNMLSRQVGVRVRWCGGVAAVYHWCEPASAAVLLALNRLADTFRDQHRLAMLPRTQVAASHTHVANACKHA